MTGFEHRKMPRRELLRLGALGSGALALACREGVAPRSPAPRDSIFPSPVPDPAGILDLAGGFSDRVLIDSTGSLSNGAAAPGRPDGMAAFPAPNGHVVLLRNHELEPGQGPPVEGRNPYDAQSPGGTTGLVVSPEPTVVESFVTSSGSARNCAGGPTPWGTWLTCEEVVAEGHGWVFEVDPTDPENDLSRTPIEGMGRYSHEAAGIDPATGIVYLTEDQGPVSYLFRYLPDDPSGGPGALLAGGRLQALALVGAPGLEARAFPVGESFEERWVDVDAADAHASAEDRGAVRFVRLEGASFDGGALWFNDTAGGESGLGQTFRHVPARRSLEPFFASSTPEDMKSPDNTVVTPWGDLWFVEDAPSGNRIMGLTERGHVYEFARNRLNDSELCGICFAPDGETAFVNVQDSAITLAIWGPFPSSDASRRHRLARAPSPVDGHYNVRGFRDQKGA